MTSEAPSRVLLADDDPAFRLLIERAVAETGCDVTAVADGAAALAETMETVPDLVLLDKFMPELDGLSACRRMRDELGEQCPPIIIVTSADSDDDIAESFDAGATDYLVKPVNWSLFKHRLAGWLKAPVDLPADSQPAKNRDCKLIVSRRGEVLETVEKGPLIVDVSESGSTTTLSTLIGSVAAESIMSVLRRALKSRTEISKTESVENGNQVIEAEITVSAVGVDKCAVGIRPVGAHRDDRSNLFRMAYFDPATELPNRHLLEICGKDRIEKAKFQSHEFTVACITYDELRNLTSKPATVRDSAKLALLSICDALRDEPLVVSYDVPDGSQPALASFDSQHAFLMIDGGLAADTERLIAILEKSGSVAGDHGVLTMRIGLSKFPDDGSSIEILIESALVAANEAARNKLTSCHVDGRAREMLRWDKDDREAALLAALDQQQIVLNYQPRVSLANGMVEAVEALIRWPHPVFGSISAKELFDGGIGAEAVRALADWAMRAAVTQAKQWCESGVRVKTSINVATEQLIGDSFANRFMTLMSELNLAPDLLELELGGDSLDSAEDAIGQLRQLQDLGVGVIVDDFGSSSIDLQLLRRLDICAFKVDHRGTCGPAGDSNASGIYSMAHAISQSRDALLIAKNIESMSDLDLARARNCDQAQGFHICQPLPADEVAVFIAELQLNQTSAIEIAASI